MHEFQIGFVADCFGFGFILKWRPILPFTSPAAKRSHPWQNNLVEAVPKAYLEEANWTKVAQLKYVDPSFSNTSPVCHGIQWPRETTSHANANVVNLWKRNTAARKSYFFIPILHIAAIAQFYFPSDQGWSRYTLSFHDSHIPGGAGIFQVVLGFQALPSELDMESV